MYACPCQRNKPRVQSEMKRGVPEEVVHARNVIAFFVWAWPSDFCD